MQFRHFVLRLWDRGTVMSLCLIAVTLTPAVVYAQPEIEIEFIRSFGTLGIAPGQFNSIAGVTVDNAGLLYVTDNDNHRIQICDYEGNCETDGSNGASPGHFQYPIGIALDQTGRIVVSDGRNFRIQIRSLQGVWSTFGSNGVNVGQFRIPGGVIVDAQNQIYIADENNGRVQACNDQGQCTVVADGFVTPRAVGFDSQGRLIISDRETNRIHMCHSNGPCTDFGSTGTSPGRFRAPTELWVDAEDRVFITDRDNHRFQVCDLNGACVAFGERGNGPGQFNSPTSVAVDSQDRIIIGDSGNNRIQIFQAVYPPTNQPMNYAIGGTVSGLAGSGLVLQNNGGDDLAVAANGAFTFATALPDGSSYAVTVLSQPGDPEQTCTVGNGSGTLAGADVTDVSIICSTETFTVGGTVSGLAGSGLVLQNNGGDDLAVAANGAFTFVTDLPDGSSYAVTVLSQPGDPEQTCAVGNGSGTLAGVDVTDVSIVCSTETFTVGGTVSGLAGSGLVLQINGGDDLAVAANGAFTFATALPDGSSYAVTVLSQPDNPEQTCTVSNGSGMLAGANVTDLSVACLLEQPDFRINVGLTDAWYNPVTDGQGFFIIVFPDISVIFMAWFTYDTERPQNGVEAILGEPGHRWITAQGPFEGDRASLEITVTRGGVFDAPEPMPENSFEGTIELVFASCTQGLVRYELLALGLVGEVPIQRIVDDNVSLCESLAE